MHLATDISQNTGEVQWADDQSLSSDDGIREASHNHHPQLVPTVWDVSLGHVNMRTGQISPASSSSMDIHMDSVPDSGSAPTSWRDTWVPEDVHQEEPDQEAHWEHESDDVHPMPKLEPLDDDDESGFEALRNAPVASSTTSELPSLVPTKQKRGRGRPRKHHPDAAVLQKVHGPKGRSKTGCMTCRRRKKKCDETKPRCMNCEKNAVICEGYPAKTVWKSGREKATDQGRREKLPNILPHYIYPGVETVEDEISWEHYGRYFSKVLTVESGDNNAFNDIVLHLANQHQGLMHSILSVSSKHIDFETQYGMQLLQTHPSTSRQALEQRSQYHHDEAIRRWNESMPDSVTQSDPEYITEAYQSVLAARYGQILFLLLKTRAEGTSTGEHRLHLKGYRDLIRDSPPEKKAFYSFITEIFQYHIYADDLMWHPDAQVERLSGDKWQPNSTDQPSRLLGVTDILRHISDITDLRTVIRKNMIAGTEPSVDFNLLYHAKTIQAAVNDWEPRGLYGDVQHRIGSLYKQVMSIYLHKTIYPPPTVQRETMSGLSSLSSSVTSTPQRRSSMATSIASAGSAPVSTSSIKASYGISLPHSCPSSRNPSRSNSMHESDSQNGIGYDVAQVSARRRATNEDEGLPRLVKDALDYLESFSSSDRAQTLLLIPSFIIGVACDNEARRERVRKAISTIRGYTGLRNCDRMLDVLEEVWMLMDAGDLLSAWDWQGVARRMGVDIPCT